MSNHAVAVIDVGTNSTNLLITDTSRQTTSRIVTTTRLGENLHSTGNLQEDAIARTVQTVAEYVEMCKQHNIADIRIVGTAACRKASNTHEFAQLVREHTAIDLHVLTERQEAQLAFEGAVTGLPPHDGLTVVVDIGGGSTEFTVGATEADQIASLEHGAVVVTDREFSSDPPAPEDLTNAIGSVADDVEELTRSMPVLLGSPRFVGVAGTIVTIAAVELGLQQFNEAALHGMVLTRDAAEDVFRTLATETFEERVHNPGLPRDRADIIVAGCCILVAIMRRLHLSEITVSTHGLLEGLARRATMDL